jgi:outer membrane cobalamin receptor
MNKRRKRKLSVLLIGIFLFLFIPLVQELRAQVISAEVFSTGGKELKAGILIKGDSIISLETDEHGKISFPYPYPKTGLIMIAFAPGYESDSARPGIDSKVVFRLQEMKELPGVEVKAQAQAAFLEKTAVIKTEVINRVELKKAACCDLAGCFETQGTVHPQVSNVLSNSKELRILGLSGIYNQILVDGAPTILGLSFPYGVSGIPGPMVENIYVSKGANSVLQGFESVSGQINVLTTAPENAEKLKTSFYINQFGEKHLNAALGFKAENHAEVFGIHLVDPANRRDRDGDGFLDVTRLQRKMAFMNGTWESENFKGEYGGRVTLENRNSGQYDYDAGKNAGSSRIYGQTIGFHQFDGRKRLEFGISQRQRLLLQLAGQFHRQESWFGTLRYRGTQGLAYGNLQHELIWNGHLLRTGFSQRWLDASEQISLDSDPAGRNFAGTYLKSEFIPGFFAENTFSFREDRLKVITGIRADHHNVYGWKLVPRMMLRWDLTENSIFRANAGRGWRTLNNFNDHVQVLSGNRNILFGNNLAVESAWNAGCSFTQNFDRNGFSGYLSGDFYYTDFENQIFPDYGIRAREVSLQNFRGISRSLYGQLEGKVQFPGGLSVRFSYSYTENYREQEGIKTILPFTPLHRGLLALSWRSPGRKWQLDMNQHFYGSQYLPDTKLNPEIYRGPEKSPAYQMLNLQVIRFLGKTEIYAGCENVFDFRQLRPITAWQEPFSPWFDTAGVWGPTRGREFYCGVRLRLE